MCMVILDVYYLIYIVGWFIYIKIKLLCDIIWDLLDGGDYCFGDFLKRKLVEGVCVFMLVWDDKIFY